MRRRERCVQAESQSKGILLLGFSQYGAQLCSMKPVYQFGFGLRRAHTPLSETSTSDDDGDDDGDGYGDEDGDDDGDGDEENDDYGGGGHDGGGDNENLLDWKGDEYCMVLKIVRTVD